MNDPEIDGSSHQTPAHADPIEQEPARLPWESIDAEVESTPWNNLEDETPAASAVSKEPVASGEWSAPDAIAERPASRAIVNVSQRTPVAHVEDADDSQKCDDLQDVDNLEDAEEAQDTEAADDDGDVLEPSEAAGAGSGWTIPLLCLGLGLIACCVVIPQADANRRQYYEGSLLRADLEQIQKQVAVNQEFLSKVRDDPALAERLASRQMKTIRKGQKVLLLKHGSDPGDMSPFGLVTVAPPPIPPPYKPVGGTIASMCYDARSRLYLMGAAMVMVAAGLVLGFGEKKAS